MRRALLVVLIVAAISGWIGRNERAVGSAGRDWVRTSEGWQTRQVLAARPPSPPAPLHPATVAAFQLTASLLFLVAFPARVTVLPKKLVLADARRRTIAAGRLAAAR